MTYEDIQDTAAGWLIALEDESKRDKLRPDFEAWRAADPRHRAAYLRLEQVWWLVGEVHAAMNGQLPRPNSNWGPWWTRLWPGPQQRRALSYVLGPRLIAFWPLNRFNLGKRPSQSKS